MILMERARDPFACRAHSQKKRAHNTQSEGEAEWNEKCEIDRFFEIGVGIEGKAQHAPTERFPFQMLLRCPSLEYKGQGVKAAVLQLEYVF